MTFEVPYGEECPNPDKGIKKTTRKICESCPFRKYIGKTFATCRFPLPARSVTTDYEEIKDAIKDCKIENDGIWLSWNDLWRIDGVAVRNAMKAMNGDDPDGIKQIIIHSFVGQRMLISEIAELVRPPKEDDDN